MYASNVNTCRDVMFVFIRTYLYMRIYVYIQFI